MYSITTAGSVLDKSLDDLTDAESKLNTYHVGFLNAVKVKYGDDSSEYETAGGTPKSKRKRPVQKAKKGAMPSN